MNRRWSSMDWMMLSSARTPWSPTPSGSSRTVWRWMRGRRIGMERKARTMTKKILLVLMEARCQSSPESVDITTSGSTPFAAISANAVASTTRNLNHCKDSSRSATEASGQTLESATVGSAATLASEAATVNQPKNDWKTPMVEEMTLGLRPCICVQRKDRGSVLISESGRGTRRREGSFGQTLERGRCSAATSDRMVTWSDVVAWSNDGVDGDHVTRVECHLTVDDIVELISDTWRRTDAYLNRVFLLS